MCLGYGEYLLANCVFLWVLYLNNGAHQDNCRQRTRKDLTWLNSRRSKKRERETAKPPANVRAALFSNCIWRCLNVIKMCAGWGQIRLRPKKIGESSGDAVSFERMRKTEVDEEEMAMKKSKGRKRKRGMKTLTAVLCECLCLARAKKNKALARLGIWFQPRAAAGNAAPPGGGVQIHSHGVLPKSTLPKHLHLFLKYLMYLCHSHSLQVRTTVHQLVSVSSQTFQV